LVGKCLLAQLCCSQVAQRLLTLRNFSELQASPSTIAGVVKKAYASYARNTKSQLGAMRSLGGGINNLTIICDSHGEQVGLLLSGTSAKAPPHSTPQLVEQLEQSLAFILVHRAVARSGHRPYRGEDAESCCTWRNWPEKKRKIGIFVAT
jgi:hypothetical protein